MRDEHSFYIRRLSAKRSLSVSSQFRIQTIIPKTGGVIATVSEKL